MTKTIEVTNRLTGEVHTYASDDPEDVLSSIDEVSADLDALRLAKSKLNERAAELWRERMKEDN